MFLREDTVYELSYKTVSKYRWRQTGYVIPISNWRASSSQIPAS